MALDGRWLGAAIGLALAAGCSFTGPSTEGTVFRCDPGNTCPDGTACLDGVCRGSGTLDEPDAPPAPRDASPADAPGVDAAPPPDAGARVLVFGEAADADVRGVTVDTWLDSSDDDVNRGGGAELYIDSQPTQVMLIRFDVSAIPAGAVIEAAELGVRVSDPGGPFDRVNMRLLERAWTEREATWQLASTGVRWPLPGAAGFALGAQVAIVAMDAAGDRVVPIAVSAVQRWVDDADTNYGLRLEVFSLSGDDVRVYSSEATSAARPYLRVTFR